MNRTDVLELAATYPLETLEPGQTLIIGGKAHHPLYVLASGRLQVEQDGRYIATIDVPGSIVGELSLLLHTAASADVVAKTPVEVRRVDDADTLLDEHPEIMRFLAETLALRLRRMTTYLVDLQVQFSDQPGTLGLVGEVLENLLHTGSPTAEPGSEREPDSPY